MTPGEPQTNAAEPIPPEPEHPQVPYRWYRKLGAVALVTIYLEMGFFLLVFPWTHYGSNFAGFLPKWFRYWHNAYVSGAISALGAVNLYIAFTEMFRLRRFRGR